MPTSYTSLLGLALPVTGELSGTWGDTVNDYITQYLDAAVAGAQTISGSQTAVTLSKTTASSLTQAGSGSTGSSQYQIINCTGNPAGLLTITAPAASKVYLVLNSTSTSQSVKVVGAGPTTGVTMVSGEKALIAWDGSDFVKVASSVADGVTTFSAGTTGFTPSTATSGAVTLAGTLATTNGGTGLTSFTANGVVYASSTSALTTGSALVFDGTNLGIGTSSPAVRLQVSSGEARARLTATNASGGSWELVSGGGGVAGAGFFSLYDVGNNAQKIVVAPSSGEAIRIDGSNNVGIGTSSPSTRLTIGGYSSANQTPDIQITRSSSGTAIQTGPNITFGDGTTNNTTTLQVTQGRFGVWNYGSGAWNERFSIDAAGNAGLGVTPSAFGAGRWMQFLSVSAVGQQQNGTANLACNAYESSANSFNYILSAAAARYNVTAGAHQWYTAPSGTAGNAISFSQVMTLNASGQLIVGGTGAGNAIITSNGGTSFEARDATQPFYQWYNSGAGTDLKYWRTGPNTSGDLQWQTVNDAYNSASNLMILSRSGNLGLGVTPSAWGSVSRAMQFQNGVSIFSNSSGLGGLGNNVYSNPGTADYYIATGFATRYYQFNGTHVWNTAASGNAGDTISFTQALTLDASGNLIVADTSPAYSFSGRGNITIGGTSGSILGFRINSVNKGYIYHDGTNLDVNNVANGYLSFATNNTERARITSDGILQLRSGLSGNQLQFWNTAGSAEVARVGANSGALAFMVGSTSVESARITSGGDLLVGQSAKSQITVGAYLSANGEASACMAASTDSTTQWNTYSTGAGAFRFYVGMGGTVYATNTTISAISDQRFKENIQDLDAGLDKIMALKPRKFDWKAGKGKDIKGDRGFIAQEFEQVFPDLIDEWKDPAPEGEEPYKSVRQDLIPVLVKAIQELKAQNDDLRARVAQLEAK